MLTVTDGGQVAQLALLGSYVTSDFSLSNDGNGGTFVTDPRAAPRTPHQSPRWEEWASPQAAIDWWGVQSDLSSPEDAARELLRAPDRGGRTRNETDGGGRTAEPVNESAQAEAARLIQAMAAFSFQSGLNAEAIFHSGASASALLGAPSLGRFGP